MSTEPKVIVTMPPAPTGVYVSASSSEIERAKKWMDALRAKGIPVNSTWIEVIEKSGGNVNPRDASVEDRQKWSLQDVKECLSSQILWLLMPTGPHSFGATFEFAFFTALSQAEQGTIVSGDYLRTIFTSFSNCYEKDEDAFARICELLSSEVVTAVESPDAIEPPKNENAAQPES